MPDKMWIPSGKIQQKKKSKLRAIDAGTRYDISGQLRKLTRSIERGEEGDIRDVLVVTRRIEVNGRVSIQAYGWGTGTIEDHHWMASTAKNRMEPA